MVVGIENIFYLHKLETNEFSSRNVFNNNNDPPKSPSGKLIKQAVSGGLSGLMTRAITHPLDVLKVRFQLQVEPIGQQKAPSQRDSETQFTKKLFDFNANRQGTSASLELPQSQRGEGKYLSLIQAGRTIYREEGILGFWKGHCSGQLATVSFMMVQFWSYERFMDRLEQYKYFAENPSLLRFICGGMAGSLSTLVSMPFDVSRTREIGQDPTEKRNIFKTLYTVATEEGIRGLFRGLNSSTVQIVPLIGLNYMFYYNFNNFLKTHVHKDDGELRRIELLITGGTAGVLSKFLLYPLDLIKKRIQLQGFVKNRLSYGRNHYCSSVRDCVVITYREEGLSGFYKGTIPTLLKSGLSTALYFLFYEIFIAMLHVESDRKAL